MRHTPFAVSFVLLFMMIPGGGMIAQDDSPQKKPAPVKKGSKGDTYSVIQVGDEVRVVKSSEVLEVRKDLAREYSEALRSYSEAQKEARKAKQKFTTPKPKRKNFRLIKSSLATEAMAEAYKEKYANKSSRKPERTPRGKQAYKVIQVDGGKYQAISFGALSELQKSSGAKYRDELIEYQKAKRAAAAKREKFSQPMPKKPSIKVLPKSFESEESAKSFIDSLQGKTTRKTTKKRTYKKSESDESES